MQCATIDDILKNYIVIITFSQMINVVELFSGIGGMHYSLKGAGMSYNVVAAIDINTSANELYKHNFPDTKVYQRNIQSLNCEDFEKLKANMITMSPPCQPFTRLGLKKDNCDERTNALLHIIELLPKLSSIKYLLLENVQGFETSNSRDALVDVLGRCGFTFQEFLLNPTDYYIPCSRLRYYLLAKRKPLKFNFQSGELMKSIPMQDERIIEILVGRGLSQEALVSCSPEKLRRPFMISTILENNCDATRYKVPMKILKKYAGVLDLTFPSSTRCCCFTKAYGRYVEGTGSVLCPLLVEDEALDILKEMDTMREAGSDNKGKCNEEMAEVLDRVGVRYFSPREIARLLCFPEEFTWPRHYSANQLYKLMGNSINVFMVTLLALVLLDGEQNES
ncbi:tRNA (cytosine(38)-C(5))-methyltransferase [Ischnura elegans]|uniref:tRNA (cytosine(38)-C(5))-methyltransferase n=1 Tax=Ischnura elegans TaxID=197161 RepID=UPI001ED87581|nr:tRNA (cytosine(38)-C(5))-methyltransferase [Ischnura elegans]